MVFYKYQVKLYVHLKRQKLVVNDCAVTVTFQWIDRSNETHTAVRPTCDSLLSISEMHEKIYQFHITYNSVYCTCISLNSLYQIKLIRHTYVTMCTSVTDADKLQIRSVGNYMLYQLKSNNKLYHGLNFTSRFPNIFNNA